MPFKVGTLRVKPRRRERPREQLDQPRIAFDFAARHARQHIGQAGRKHDLVAETLLGVNHQRARRIGGAVPARQQRILGVVRIAAADAVFVFAPAFGIASLSQQPLRMKRMRFRIVGRRGQRALQKYRCAVHIAQIEPDQRGIDQRVGMRGVEFERARQRRRCVIQAPGVVHAQAEICQQRRVVRRHLERGPEQLLGARPRRLQPRHVGLRVQYVDRVRARARCVREDLLGLAQQTAAAVNHAQPEQCFGIVRIAPAPRFVERPRLGIATRREMRRRQFDAGGAIPRCLAAAGVPCRRREPQCPEQSGQHHALRNPASSRVIASMTGCQSPAAVWRNMRTPGYHGMLRRAPDNAIRRPPAPSPTRAGPSAPVR